MKRLLFPTIALQAALLFPAGTSLAAPQPRRRVLSLDGTWKIAEGKLDVVPTTFGRTVPVPGLTSLAAPPFVDPPGPKVADRGKVPQKDPSAMRSGTGARSGSIKGCRRWPCSRSARRCSAPE